jgi:flagellar hook assembly protein FlgD
LKERGYVKMYVYDIKGELVSTLVNKEQEAGYFEVDFDAQVLSSEYGVLRQLASGIYLYQVMITNENGTPVFSDMKKMILLR